MKIDCVIPAAGLSKRMGKWKLVLPYRDRTVIETSIANALTFCSRIILVTGHRAEEFPESVMKDSRIKRVFNSNYRKGMFSSIQRGVMEVETEYFFITMGDMPGIGKDIFSKLFMIMKDSAGVYDIVRPLYKGERGHPVLLRREVAETILSHPKESAMKEVFRDYRVKNMELGISDTFTDIDTPADYSRIKEES